jgi:hypothetical protein
VPRSSKINKITNKKARKDIIKLANEPEKVKEYVERIIPFLSGAIMTDFTPRKGYPGTILEIHGWNFAKASEDNHVTVGGKPAIVVYSSPTLLKVITNKDTKSGPVEIMIGATKFVGSDHFRLEHYLGADSSRWSAYFL